MTCRALGIGDRTTPMLPFRTSDIARIYALRFCQPPELVSCLRIASNCVVKPLLKKRKPVHCLILNFIGRTVLLAVHAHNGP